MAGSADLVAKALNRLNDKAFTDVLTDHDAAHSWTSSMSFFYSALDPSEADDSGKLAIINDDNNEYSQELCTLRVQFWSFGWLDLGT